MMVTLHKDRVCRPSTTRCRQATEEESEALSVKSISIRWLTITSDKLSPSCKVLRLKQTRLIFQRSQVWHFFFSFPESNLQDAVHMPCSCLSVIPTLVGRRVRVSIWNQCCTWLQEIYAAIYCGIYRSDDPFCCQCSKKSWICAQHKLITDLAHAFFKLSQ